MEKYIILIVILFLLLLYLNKNIEGLDIGETYGWKSGVIEGRKQFSVKDISQSQIIFDKCNQANSNYIPQVKSQTGQWLGNSCLNKCEHKRLTKNGKKEQHLDGNCGETLYRDDTLKNYKLCPKKCTSTFKEQEEEDERREKGGDRINCLMDNECSTCYKDILYENKILKCGNKTSCPMALTRGYDADGSGVILPMDGCGGYTDNDVDTNGSGGGDSGGLGGGGLGGDGLGGGGLGGGGLGGGDGGIGGGDGGLEDTNSSNNPWEPLNPNSSGDPWEPINEKVNCSTYPNHPKCGHTHKPQMFGCVNNAKEGEINSMSKPGTLDSSWGLFK